MRTKKEITTHILALMKEKGLTKSALGEALGATGVSQMKVQRANGFLSDKNEKLNMADLLVVAQFLGVAPKDLVMRPEIEREIDKKLPQLDINPNHLVPLLNNTDTDQDMIQEWLVYPYDNSAHKKITAIAMPDVRMQPMIKKGEILFVDSRLYSFKLSNRVVLAIYNNEFVVGRFKRLRNGQVQISFENSKHEPMTYSLDNENLEIIGVVISHFAEIK